jgi:CDP-diacylglycerol pyrophosphatase
MQMKRFGVAIALVVGLVAVAAVLRHAVDPDALWKIVHNRCVPDQAGRSDPAPCVLVDLTKRWAVFKDAVGDTQFLLLATDPVTGVEDPLVLAPQAPNYWGAAWDARRFVAQRARRSLTNDQVALAINSRAARSQNQLHIHVDCVRSDVHDALHLMQSQFTTTWIRTRIGREEYKIRRIGLQDLHDKNLFSLVAEQLAPGQGMDLETIVLIGATSHDEDGFDLLVGRAGVDGNRGSGEILQDHSCAIARTAP